MRWHQEFEIFTSQVFYNLTQNTVEALARCYFLLAKKSVYYHWGRTNVEGQNDFYAPCIEINGK